MMGPKSNDFILILSVSGAPVSLIIRNILSLALIKYLKSYKI